MKIDLHVHAQERSRCARAGEEEMIQAAIGRGLDGIAFTDHHRLVPSQRLKELNQKYASLRVFGGIEISVSGEDVLVLGLHDVELETQEWTYPELHTFVRRRDGFLVLAHPFRFHNAISIDLESYPPDAIELCSVNIKSGDQDRIRALAERLDLRLLCNSDAHRAKDVGCYYNLLSQVVANDAELVSILRNGGLSKC
jgi:histidinol phosphatase-like PHP family hydrolase